MIYFIFKGLHWCLPRTFRKHKSNDPVLWRVKFHHNSWYSIGNNKDEKDLNKLCGISFGKYHEAHHDNSFRIAWLPDEEKGKIRLFLYCYVDGKRITQDLHLRVRTGRRFDIYLNFEKIRNEIYGTVDGVLFRQNLAIDPIDGYFLGFYHGGNLPAKKFISCSISS